MREQPTHEAREWVVSQLELLKDIQIDMSKRGAVDSEVARQRVLMLDHQISAARLEGNCGVVG